MKKNIFYLAIAVMAIAFVISCNKNSSSTDDQQIVEVSNPFDFVGEMHNEGLDYVLGSLSPTKTKDANLEEIERLPIRSARKFSPRMIVFT